MTYSDGYSLSSYGQMIEDSARFAPWREALRRHVRADSVVLDIGCGPGILSFLACQFGARKVYAVEPDDSIEVGRHCAADIPGAERIEWIRGMSTDITLPEPADLVLGDLHGNTPFYTGNIASLADARRRHLRPGGVLLPHRDLLYAVPASAPWEIESIEAPWRRNQLGLELSAALPWLVNTCWRARGQPTEPEQLLADPAAWGTVDYRAEETRGLDRTLEWTIARAGRLDGFYVWFDGEIDDGLGFSNSPLLPELVYGRMFFPLERGVEVQAGDGMQTRLAVRRVQEDWIYRWDTRITRAEVGELASFRQSTFRLLPGATDRLRKSEAGHVPRLSDRGRIQQAILASMDGQQTVGEIARQLLARFPEQFQSYDRALAEVADCSRRYA